MKNPALLVLSSLVLLVTTTMANAQRALYFSGCAFDRPCITKLSMSISDALIATVNAGGYDVINTRWSRPGRSGGNTGFPGGNDRRITILSKATVGVVYTVGVQGCKKRILQSSICTGWDNASITAY